MLDLLFQSPELNHGKLQYENLIELDYLEGKQDCFEILRTMYKDNLNINITNYARPKDFWLYPDFDMYLDFAQPEGFFPLKSTDKIQPLDVYLISIPDPRNRDIILANHCAVALTENYVVHHRSNCKSSVVKYSGALKNLTVCVMRHKDTPVFKLEEKTTSLDLMEYILPHKKIFLQGALDEHKNN